MRTAVTVSLAAHAALIVASIIAIPAARLDLSADIEVIPVQMIDVAEFTELTIGLDNVVPVEPEPVAPEPAPPEPLPPEPEPEPAPPEAAPPEAVPPEPEPVVEPEPPAAEPEVVEPAEIAAAEPEVRVIEPGPAPAPVAEPGPEPEPVPEPAPEPQPAAIVPMPTPRPRPTAAPEPEPEPEPVPAEPEPPAPEPIPEPEPAADPLATEIAEARGPDAIAALLNTPEPETTEPPGAPDGVDNAAMTQSEIDAFYSALSRCWDLPAIWDNNPAEFTVVVRFQLNIDGTVRGIPLVVQPPPPGPYAQVAREAALRAVLECAPYQLPVQKYETWRENTVTFNPVDMFLP